jgi:uncharacterized protein (DUF2384 family)
MSQRVKDYSDRTMHRARQLLRAAAAADLLTTTQRERVHRLLLRADQAIGDPESADRWASAPLGVLDGMSPLETAADNEEGLEEALRVLGRIEHGVF